MSEDRFDALLKLPEGWDTYGSPQIDAAVVERARLFLKRMSIVPCSGGGVQLEWHTHGIDLEIEFAPDGTTDASLELAPPREVKDA